MKTNANFCTKISKTIRPNNPRILKKPINLIQKKKVSQKKYATNSKAETVLTGTNAIFYTKLPWFKMKAIIQIYAGISFDLVIASLENVVNLCIENNPKQKITMKIWINKKPTNWKKLIHNKKNVTNFLEQEVANLKINVNSLILLRMK